MVSQPDTAALLRRYGPVVQYDSHESFYADSAAIVTDLVVGERCNFLKSGRTIVAAGAPKAGQGQLSLDFLTGTTYPGDRSVSRDDLLDETGRDYVADAARMHVLPGYAHHVYGHAAHDEEDRIWLQYWFFYYYNNKAFLGIGCHEGDWEMIQIRLDRAGRPNVATYAQHRQGERASWRDVEREDTPDGPVPVVYSARGSHASYFQPGVYPQAPVVPDQNDAGGPRVRPEVVVISDATPGWAQWPGHWGSTPRDNVFESDSPRGPREHDQWKEPGKFHAAARQHKVVDVTRAAQVALAATLAPPTPAIDVRREGRHAVIDYSFPTPAGGQASPVGILATVDAPSDPRPPATYSFPISDLRGSIEHPLELEERAYEVRVRGFSQEGLESELVTRALPP
jgi:Vacuolar protein sorting-associated protein 62